MQTRKLSRVERLWKVSVLNIFRDVCQLLNVCHVKLFSVFLLSRYEFNQSVIEHEGHFQKKLQAVSALEEVSEPFIYLLSFQTA